VVSFILRPLYPRDKSPLYPLGRRLGGPQTGLDAVLKRRTSTAGPAGNPTARNLVSTLTELPRLMDK